MECPECNTRIPDMAKFCPECGTKLSISGLSTKIEDSVVTRSPGAGGNYAPVINVSSNVSGNASSKEQKNPRCPNCDMEISKDNKPLVCMECGAKFCENCEGFYRHELRQRGEKPLCYRCYTAIAGESSKKYSEPVVMDKTASVAENIEQVRCPHCGKVNITGNFFCVSCGTQIKPKTEPDTFSKPVNNIPVATPSTTKKTSAAWWLLPLFFTWIGGTIAWLAIRDSDKAKAKRLLIFGIAMVFVWILLYVIATLIGLQYQM